MSCKVLLDFMGKELKDLFNDPKSAEGLIASLQDTGRKSRLGRNRISIKERASAAKYGTQRT